MSCTTHLLCPLFLPCCIAHRCKFLATVIVVCQEVWVGDYIDFYKVRDCCMRATALNYPVVRNFSCCPCCLAHRPFQLVMEEYSHPVIRELIRRKTGGIDSPNMCHKDRTSYRSSNHNTCKSHCTQL